jgi:hypothetical protein
MNTIINADRLYPPEFSASDSVLGIPIDLAGKWGKWEISNNASGGKINLRCEISSGSVKYGDKNVNVNDGSNASYVEIEVLLKGIQANPQQWVSGDDRITGDTRCHQLMIDADNTVIVTGHSFTGPDMSKDGLSSVMPELFQEWFNDNAEQFGQIFSVILIGLEAGNSDFQWLYPSAYSYAANSSIDGNTTGFGVLTLIDGKTDTGSLQQSVDVQALNLVKTYGANLALVVSKTMFVKHILLPAAISIVKGSSEHDFTISDTGLSLSNNREMVWQDFEDGKGGTFSPVLPKESFVLTLQSDFIHLSIANAHYRPNGMCTVSMGVEQNFRYKVEKNASGEPVFVPDETGVGDATVLCTVKPDEWVGVMDIVLGVISLVAMALTAGSAGAAWLAGRAAATITEDAAEGVAMFTIEGTDLVGDESVTTVEEISTAAEAVASGRNIVPTLRNAVKVFGAVAVITGAPAAITLIIKDVYKNKYDDVPSFHAFASAITGSAVWPNIKNTELKSASLADSFVIGLELK